MTSTFTMNSATFCLAYDLRPCLRSTCIAVETFHARCHCVRFVICSKVIQLSLVRVYCIQYVTLYIKNYFPSNRNTISNIYGVSAEIVILVARSVKFFFY